MIKSKLTDWYERLSKFFEWFSVGKVDTTLFIKNKGHDLLIV